MKELVFLTIKAGKSLTVGPMAEQAETKERRQIVLKSPGKGTIQNVLKSRTFWGALQKGEGREKM